MSKDDIIRNWKDQDPQPAEGGTTPANPAGEVEMPDDELEQVAGGSCGTEYAATIGCCTTPFCPNGATDLGVAT